MGNTEGILILTQFVFVKVFNNKSEINFMFMFHGGIKGFSGLFKVTVNWIISRIHGSMYLR